MSDNELSKGLRVFINGGAGAVDSNTIKSVISIGQQTLRDRDANNMTGHDAAYFKKYLKVCDEFLSGSIDESEANRNLGSLNEEYENLISPESKKEELMGHHLAGYEGWVASQIC